MDDRIKPVFLIIEEGAALDTYGSAEEAWDLISKTDDDCEPSSATVMEFVPRPIRCRDCKSFAKAGGGLCPIQHWKCDNPRGIRYIEQDGSSFCSFAEPKETGDG